MLSYNHIYHAGCAADVFKHTVLSLILKHLNVKDKPYTIIDTHAGSALYNLDDERAKKTGEASLGIMRLASYAAQYGVADEVKPYLNLVKVLNTNHLQPVTYYPGSPMIEYSFMRKCDNLILCELHPTEAEALRRNMPFGNVHIHKRDGYEAAIALHPRGNTSYRGLVFMDPSYEDIWEYDKATSSLLTCRRVWPATIIALWYPVLDKRDAERQAMLTRLKSSCNNDKIADIRLTAVHGNLAMSASGMLILNSPWHLEDEANAAVHFIERILS